MSEKEYQRLLELSNKKYHSLTSDELKELTILGLKNAKNTPCVYDDISNPCSVKPEVHNAYMY